MLFVQSHVPSPGVTLLTPQGPLYTKPALTQPGTDRFLLVAPTARKRPSVGALTSGIPVHVRLLRPAQSRDVWLPQARASEVGGAVRGALGRLGPVLVLALHELAV